MKPIKGMRCSYTAKTTYCLLSYIAFVMSVRQLCKQTAKQPAKALFYFLEENKTGIAPTRIIKEDGKFTEGRLVTVNWAGQTVPAEILALSGK